MCGKRTAADVGVSVNGRMEKRGRICESRRLNRALGVSGVATRTRWRLRVNY